MGIHISFGSGHYHGGHHNRNVTTIKSRKGLIGFGIVWLLITSLFLGIFIFVNNRTGDFVETTGIIIDNKYDSYDDLYTAIAEYEVDGFVYTVSDNSSSSFPKKIGEEVTILYNPQNPNDAEFKLSKNSLWFVYIIIAVFYAVGIFVLIKGFRTPRDGDNIDNNHSSDVYTDHGHTTHY